MAMLWYTGQEWNLPFSQIHINLHCENAIQQGVLRKGCTCRRWSWPGRVTWSPNSAMGLMPRAEKSGSHHRDLTFPLKFAAYIVLFFLWCNKSSAVSQSTSEQCYVEFFGGGEVQLQLKVGFVNWRSLLLQSIPRTGILSRGEVQD